MDQQIEFKEADLMEWDEASFIKLIPQLCKNERIRAACMPQLDRVGQEILQRIADGGIAGPAEISVIHGSVSDSFWESSREVLCIGWEAEGWSPMGSGCLTVNELDSVYGISSSDYGFCGPYSSFVSVLSTEFFTAPFPNASVSSELLSHDELQGVACRVLGWDREDGDETILINNHRFHLVNGELTSTE